MIKYNDIGNGVMGNSVSEAIDGRRLVVTLPQ